MSDCLFTSLHARHCYKFENMYGLLICILQWIFAVTNVTFGSHDTCILYVCWYEFVPVKSFSAMLETISWAV